MGMGGVGGRGKGLWQAVWGAAAAAADLRPHVRPILITVAAALIARVGAAARSDHLATNQKSQAAGSCGGDQPNQKVGDSCSCCCSCGASCICM